MKIRLIGATAALAAMTLVGCASSPSVTSGGYGGGGYGGGDGYGRAPVGCYDCGTVTKIDTRSRGGNTPNATGAVLGGVVGALAGREIANRTSDSDGRRNNATAAGAIGGAIAGNAVQNRVQGQAVYDVHVRMDDGRMNVVSQGDLGGIREGSAVRVTEGRAWLR